MYIEIITFIESKIEFFSRYPNTSIFILVTSYIIYEYYRYYKRNCGSKRRVFRKFISDHLPILVVIYLIILSVVVVNELPLDLSLKNSLISEIVGGGFISIIIAFTIQKLTEKKEASDNRRETLFKFEKILRELRSVLLNSKENIKFDEEFSFLLGNSHIMDLYKVCQINTSDLIRCRMDFDGAARYRWFVSKIVSFFDLATQTISVIRKINSILSNLARKINSDLGKSTSFDQDLIVYMRGHISGYSQKKVQPWLVGFSDIDRRNIETKIIQSIELTKNLKNVKKSKVKLLKIAKEIDKEIREYQLD